MQRGRRRWGVSWSMSLGAHALVMIACLFGGTSYRETLRGQGVRETAIDFDLVPAVEAAVPEAAMAAPALAPVVPRRGHTVRPRRPARAVPVAMPIASVEPPAFTPEPSSEAMDDHSGAAGAATSGGVAFAAPAPRVITAAPPADVPAVSAAEARYLRTYETFPSLPRSLWVSGRVYAVLAQVCVSAQGQVSDVSIKRGAAAELDRVVVQTMRSWQYRPRLIQGTPRPFCHLMKLEFSLR